MDSQARRGVPGEGLPGRALPLALPLAASVAIVALTAPPDETDWLLLSIAGLATLVVTTLTFALPWHSMRAWTEAMLPLGSIGIIYLLGEATDRTVRVYSPLLLLPLFWLALHGTRGQLMLGYTLSSAALVTSQSLHEGFGSHELRFTILALISTFVVCFTAQSLVQRIRAQSDQLNSLAHTDSLTGLPNRRSWDETLARELARAHREGGPVSIAVLDLDHFKRYNDRKGHLAGDKLLREAAQTWVSELRASDYLARYGGEEFTIILPGADLAGGLEIIERVRRATPRGEKASAGVAAWDGEEGPDVLFARADAALYQAKLTGRDRTIPTPISVRRARKEKAGSIKDDESVQAELDLSG